MSAAVKGSSVEMKATAGTSTSSQGGITGESGDTGDNSYDSIGTLRYRTDDGVNRSEAGFWGALSAEQEAKLKEARRRCDEEGIDLNYLSAHSLAWQLTLLRFLRGNKWVVDDCITSIHEGIKWRDEVGMAGVRKKPAADILGVPFKTLHDIYHHWHGGYDKIGRPVIYRAYKTFNATGILAQVDLKQVNQYFAWEQEIHMAISKEASERTGFIVETTLNVLDLEGMRLAQVTNDFLTLVRMSADVGKIHYPETLGKLYIINAPGAFSFVWRMIKPWLDPDVVAKIEILSNKKDWSKALEEVIGMEGVPANWGGALPELTTKQHAYFGILDHLGITMAEEYYDEKKRQDEILEAEQKRLEQARKEEQERRLSFGSVEEEEHLDRTTFRRKDSTARRRSSGEAGDNRRQTWDDEDIWKDNEGDTAKSKRGSTLGGFSRWWWGGNAKAEGAEAAAGNGHWEDELYGKVHGYDSQEDSDSVDSSHFSDAFDCAESASSYGDNMRDKGHSHRRHSSHTKGWRRGNPYDLEGGVGVDSEDEGVDQGHHAPYSMGALCQGGHFWRKYPTTALAKLLERVIFVFIFFYLVVLALCTYLFSSPEWLGLVLYQWTNIVTLFLALLGICVNFLGWIGLRASNAPLLSLFSSGLVLMQLIYVATAVSSFIYAENTQNYNIGIGIGTTFLLLVSSVPVTLGFAMVTRMRKKGANVDLKRQETEMASILTLTNALTTLASVAMLILGGAGLDVLLDEFREKGTEGADLVAFSLYLIVIVAVFTMLTGVLGLWAATSAHRSVVRAYYLAVLPLSIVFLNCTAIESFLTVAHRESTTGEGTGWNVLLMVSGVYLVFIAIFQFFSVAAARFRSLVMLRQREMEIFVGEQKKGGASAKDSKAKFDNQVKLTFGLKMLRAGTDKASLEGDMGVRLAGKNHIVRRRSTADRLLIVYGVTLGCVTIFYSLTSVMYSALVAHNAVFGWFGALFDLIAKADSRYGSSGDTYLIALFVISGTVSGPGLLLYAWSIFVRASWRHVTGVSVGILLLFCQILYYSGTETPVNNSNVTVFTLLMLLPSVIFNVLIPLYVLWREINASVRSAQRSENIDLYLEMKSQTNEERERDLESGGLPSFDDGTSPRSAPGRIPGSTGIRNRGHHSSKHSDKSFRLQDIDEEAEEAGSLEDNSKAHAGGDGGAAAHFEERPALSVADDSYSVYGGDSASAGATTTGGMTLSRQGSSDSLSNLSSSGHGGRGTTRSDTGTPIALHSSTSIPIAGEGMFQHGVPSRPKSRSPGATTSYETESAHTDDGTTGMKKIRSAANLFGAFESGRSRQKRTSSDDTDLLPQTKPPTRTSRSKSSHTRNAALFSHDNLKSKSEAEKFIRALQDLDQDSMII